LTADHIVALTAVATVVLTGVGVVLALRGVRHQLWLQMFSEYTRRYAQIVEGLPSESRRPGGNFDLEGLDEAARGGVENAVRAYLNLCSEEYYLHKRGHVDDETWRIWRLGMEATFGLPWIQATWAAVEHEYGFYEEFQHFVAECIAAAAPD
jgi:hypothetical protein